MHTSEARRTSSVMVHSPHASFRTTGPASSRCKMSAPNRCSVPSLQGLGTGNRGALHPMCKQTAAAVRARQPRR